MDEFEIQSNIKVYQIDIEELDGQSATIFCQT